VFKREIKALAKIFIKNEAKEKTNAFLCQEGRLCEHAIAARWHNDI
jgi:hypothetical protein